MVILFKSFNGATRLNTVQMDNGEPQPSFEGIAAAFADAKAEKEKQEAQGLKPTSTDNRAGQVHFKAAHGIVIAFFTWILYGLLWFFSEGNEANQL